MNPRGLAYQWDLFWMLTRTEFRLRDQGTVAGFLWTLLHPLFIFIILHQLFTTWMAPRVANYPAYLLIGIIQWNFFSTATTAGLTSLRRKSGLIASYSFPRIIIVLSSVSAVLLSHLLEWAVLLAALLAFGIHPSPAWLLLPLLIAVELALAVALSCALAVLAVDIRDLEHVWSLLLYGVFFLTPVFYTMEIVGSSTQPLVAANPLTLILGATRAALIDGGFFLPPGAPASLAVLAAACILSFCLFNRLSRGIVERL